MIAYIQGSVLKVRRSRCLVATKAGVGYEIKATAQTLKGLEQGQLAELYVYTVVREDALELYGFFTLSERDLFGELLGVSKLGPKTALAILATFTPQELVQIAEREDVQELTRVSGIGPKSAKRIMWEIKDKLLEWAGTAKIATPFASAQEEGSVSSDALSGLCGLGYLEEEIRPVLWEVLQQEPDLDTGETIRACLRRLVRHNS